jgi:hypothetical protein
LVDGGDRLLAVFGPGRRTDGFLLRLDAVHFFLDSGALASSLLVCRTLLGRSVLGLCFAGLTVRGQALLFGFLGCFFHFAALLVFSRALFGFRLLLFAARSLGARQFQGDLLKFLRGAHPHRILVGNR